MTSSLPSRVRILIASLVAVLVTLPAFADGGRHHPKLDRALEAWQDQASTSVHQRVIVRLKTGRRGAFLNQFRGGRVAGDHAIIEGVTVDLPRGGMKALEDNPDVESVSLDAPITPHAVVTVSGAVLRTTLGLASTPGTTGPTGNGVGVAIIDSGISSSNAFGSRITAFYDFTSGTPVASTPVDPYGHGTHVAGLIAGSGSPSANAYAGVAPGASLIGLRVLDNKGGGYTSNVIAALQFATANRVALNIKVINLSLGHPTYESAATDPLVAAVEAANRAGIVVVTSAGNYGQNPTTGEIGYAGVTSPGIAPSAITVGAVDTNGTTTRDDDTVAAYSSRGPTWYDGRSKPDVVAPGSGLVAVGKSNSTIYVTYPSTRVGVANDPNNRYLKLSGTSMASAVTAGVVALMIEAHQQAITWNTRPLTPNTIKAMLQVTAIPMYDPANWWAPYDQLTQGTGQLNADGAVTAAKSVDAAVARGGYWVVAYPNTYSLIGTQYYNWSQHLVWGNHIVWGNSLLYHEAGWDTTDAWGVDATHLVWGNLDWNDSVWDQHLVWGNHIVWGNALVGIVDAEHIVWGNLNAGSLTGNADMSGANSIP
jgi:serine protease AprX